MPFDQYVEHKKYVIWDWNGTLLDDVVYAWETGNKLLQKEGKETVEMSFYKDHFCFPVSEYYRKLGFNVDDQEDFERICDDFVEIYMKNIKSCNIKSGMKEVLQEFSDRGLKQSVLSAADQASLNTMIEHFGLNSFFEKVYGLANRQATCKIGRGGLLIDSLQSYDKKDILIVGDTLHDLEVGRSHGIDVVLVSHGHNSVDRLNSEHDWVVEIN